MDLTRDGRPLVRGLSLELQPGERLVLVGPNGSGKSTLLRAVAGLAEPSRGRIDRPATPPGMLFQEGALWPHLTVEQHLAFVDTSGDLAWRDHLLTLFSLGALRRSRPDRMSGGERVRLALARTFAGRPAWVLLDEPLTHLDPAIQGDVRQTLPMLVEELGATALTVTHDPDDVLLFGRRLLALDGRGGWWLGDARTALESPPTASLAVFCGRGTVLQGRADDRGEVDLGVGLTLQGRRPGESVSAFLDAAAVQFGDSFETEGEPAVFVAPDRRGGSWLRIGPRLFRSAHSAGHFRPGDAVSVRIVGEPRPLQEGVGA